MKILLATLGSTGDIRPFLAAGLELQHRGHRVTIATQVAFRAEVEERHLAFFPLIEGPELNQLDMMMLEIFKRGTGPRIVDYFYDLILGELSRRREQLLAELDRTDLVLASYLFPFLALFAEGRGVPALTLSLSHRFFPSRNHHPLLERRRQLPGNPAFWRFFFWFIHRKLQTHLKHHRLTDLLPPEYELRDFYTSRTIFGVPSIFEANLAAADRSHRFTGAIHKQDLTSTLPPEVDEFLGDKPIPLLNFGSVTFTRVDRVLRTFLRHWPQERKILVQTGWAGLHSDNSPPNVLFTGSLSHATLFPRLSSIIHHGGAGTTAAALHAGLPQIIVPHIADQWFIAGEIERLGLGIELPRRNWPRRLPGALQRLEGDLHLQRRVDEAARQLRGDRGLENLADRVEEFAQARGLR